MMWNTFVVRNVLVNLTPGQFNRFLFDPKNMVAASVEIEQSDSTSTMFSNTFRFMLSESALDDQLFIILIH